MINDVSNSSKAAETISSTIVKRIKKCKMLRTKKSLKGDNDFDGNDEYGGGGGVCDCPADSVTSTSTAAITTDVNKIKHTSTSTSATSTTKTTRTAQTKSNRRHLEITKGKIVGCVTETSRQLTAMNRKKISPTKAITKTTTTTTTASTMSTTAPPTHTKSRTSTIKKSQTLRKNKCPLSEAHELSSQRALKAITSRSIISPLYGKTQSTKPTKNKSTDTATATATETSKTTPKSIRCEPLEPIGQSKQSAVTSLSLAEKKAQLRSEFFKDSSNQDQRDNDCKASTKTVDRQEEHSPQEFLELELKKEADQTVLVPSSAAAPAEKFSLIAQRKLELTRKFTSHSTVKSAANRRQRSPLVEFRRVAKLVQKFDRLEGNKMIVNPDRALGAPQTEQTMLTLKPDVQDQRHNSPLSDEGCNLGQSPYSTDEENDNDDNVSIRTTSTMIETVRNSSKRKDKVARSASSDSALGLEVDDPMDASTTTTVSPMTPPLPNEYQQQKRRMTLTVTDLPLRPALLPLAEPTTLPDSPTPDIQQTTLQNLIAQTSIPSKVLLEERVVELPKPEPSSLRSAVACPTNVSSHVSSRRDSEQSSASDFPMIETGNVPGVRYVRTPSVVVSDYSDDVMCGITLEEIEYFRAQRLRRQSLDASGNERDGDSPSDVSASSSCSNLYYCGSTISALDGTECLVNGQRVQLERKASDCSTCSTSGNEDETISSTTSSSSAYTLTEDNSNGKDISDLLAAQHLCSKRAKKVCKLIFV